MPADHLRALIQQNRPGVSVRKLERDAGLEEGRIGYYLKPATVVDQMPKMRVLEDIAGALKCDLLLVIEAFAADAGIPWGERITGEFEREAVYLLRLLNDEDRSVVIALLRGLTRKTHPA